MLFTHHCSLGLCVLSDTTLLGVTGKGARKALNHAGKISYTSDIHPDSLKASKVSRGITDKLEGRVHGTQGVASLASTENKASKKGHKPERP